MLTKRQASCIAITLLTAVGVVAKPPPLSIDELRSKAFDTRLEFVSDVKGGDSFDAHLVSYISAGLKVHALVATPRGEKPAGGFPVLVANHGHHPDPPRYGITAEGVDWRPGDYYRAIPELYAAMGFLVVMPDYRGHSNSEGFEFTDGMLESLYCTEDVLGLVAALRDIEDADPQNVFMWGHSLGGEVTLRALLAADVVKGASLWSSVGGDIWDQSFYYSRYKDPLAMDSAERPKEVIDKLREDMAALDGPFAWEQGEPLDYLEHLKAPIIIHHAIGDRGAAYMWAARLAKELYLRSHPYEFHTYAGEDHLFKGADLEEATARDGAFFRSLMAP